MQISSSGDQVAALIGPVPSLSRVNLVDGSVFDAATLAMGPDIPRDYPKKYTENLQRVDIFNSCMAWDMDELRRWLKRHGADLSPEQADVFERYLKADYAIRMMLIDHPKVNRPEESRDFSVVLQRGVIVYDKGKETLFLRSYVHSAKRGQDSTRSPVSGGVQSSAAADFVNFAPKGGVQMSFISNTVWFPLETTNGCVAEAASYVMLDILTTTTLDASQLPKPFQLEKRGRMQYQGVTYQVARITAKLAARQRWPDLNLNSGGIGATGVPKFEIGAQFLVTLSPAAQPNL